MEVHLIDTLQLLKFPYEGLDTQETPVLKQQLLDLNRIGAVQGTLDMAALILK